MAAKVVTGPYYFSGDGDDDVVGNGLAQTFDTGGGRDKVRGAGGADLVYGGDGSDVLHGDAGDDVLWGASTYETGTSDADRLYGDAGNDRLMIGTSRFADGGSPLPAVADGGAGLGDSAVVTVNAYDGGTDRPVVFRLSAAAGSTLTIGGRATLLVKGIERIEIRNATGDAADSLTGGNGNDILSAGGGDDVLRGLGGDDVLDGGTGKLDIDGGAGTDIASFDLSDATTALVLRAGGANALGAHGRVVGIEAFGKVSTGSGADTVSVGNAGATVDANAGADTVTGGRGNDTFYGGRGADVLTGGRGDDVLSADGALVYSGSDDNGGDDRLDGGAGNDTLIGGDGRDRLDGGAGNDTLTYDEPYSEREGIDTFLGGAGTDTLELRLDGFGDERIVAVLGAETVVRQGALTFLKATSMEVLHLGTAYGAPVTARGGNGADSFSTGRGDDVLRGLGGDDTIESGSGTDDVDAGAGNDAVSAVVGGRDVIRTGANDDTLTLLYNGPANTVFDKAAVYDLGAGTNDTFALREYTGSFSAGPAALSFDGTTLTNGGKAVGTVLNYERFVYSASDYAELSTTLNGTARADELHMGGGNDTARGGKGDDALFGDSGNDTLEGGAGNDTIRGGAGSDRLDGGTGSDTLDYSDRSYLSQTTPGLTITLTGAKTFKVVDTAFKSTDTISNFENVVGTSQNDRITGDNGANRLAGGYGNDVLKGLGGADTFVFSHSGKLNADRIVDFRVVDDSIGLSRAQFTALTGDARTGVLTAGAFKDVTDPKTKLDADDHVLYDATAGTLSYDADGSGAGAAQIVATLDNHAALTFRDILLV